MQESFLYIWPRANTQAIFWGLIAVAVLLAIAICIVYARRRRERRRKIMADWNAVRELAREKDFTPDELRSLESLLKKQAPDAPLKAATNRPVFDKCIEREMASVFRGSDSQAYDERGKALRAVRERLGLDVVSYGQRTQSTRDLTRGQTLWAAAHADPASEWRRLVATEVNEAYFTVAPMRDEPLPRVKVGDELRFRMWREEDARYTFSATVKSLNAAPAEISFHHTELLKRLQARAHFRIRQEQRVTVGALDVAPDRSVVEIERAAEIGRQQGKLVSLSGGGFAALVSDPLPKSSVVRISLELDVSAEPIALHGRPIAMTPVAAGKYLLRASFIGIDDDLREAITRYVFRQQQHLVEHAGLKSEPE